jgi:precorrin-6B methylase 2
MKNLVRTVTDHLVRMLPPQLCYSLASRMVGRVSASQSRYLFEQAANVHRKHLQLDLLRSTSGVVQDGPFRGLVLPDTSSWGDGDYVPKLLGFYECELHEIICAASREYQRFIDIGCAEGFYAVGFALLNSKAEVFAFDSSPEARMVCASSAKTNGVTDQVVIGGHVDAPLLQRLLSAGKKTLLFMDCEGCEFELLDPASVPALSCTDFVAECHNFAVRDMATLLQERFGLTHRVAQITEIGRDPNRSNYLRDRNSYVRWLAVNERRPTTMEWLHGRALKPNV